MSDVTTQEVRDALDTLSTVETHSDDNVNGLLISVDESEVGKLIGALRRNGFEWDSGRIGGRFVTAIEAEPRGLGELFG